MNYILNTPNDADRACEAIKALPTGKGLVVKVSEKSETRNSAQHRLKWCWMKQLESDLAGVGYGYDADQYNSWLKARFMTDILKAKDEYWIGWFDNIRNMYADVQDKDGFTLLVGGFLETKDLSVKEMSEFMNRVDKWAISQGVVLNTPRDLEWAR